ncbi:MAG: HAD-IA family hydrolase [Pseudomonadota bacterium]
MRPTALSHYDCVFFDFDGVIVDSVEAKITAFGELYDQFGPDIRAAVEAYQRKVPGQTRYEKIPRFHRQLLGIELSRGGVEVWADKLSEIVLDRVVASPLLPDVAETLSLLSRRDIPAHIVSGTPHDELQEIVDRKGLRPFFVTARGAPEKKAPIVRDIMTHDRLEAKRCLFVGDAMTDYECAKECGLDFIGCAQPQDDPFPQGTYVLERLGEFFLAPEPDPATPLKSRLRKAA